MKNCFIPYWAAVGIIYGVVYGMPNLMWDICGVTLLIQGILLVIL